MQWVESSKSIFTKISWVIIASSFMQLIYFLHILLVKTEICNVWVLFHSLDFDAFWNYGQSLLYGPSQHDLMRRYIMIFCNFLYFIVFINWFFALFRKSYFLIRTGPKTGVAYDLNTFFPWISNKLLFTKFWVDFCLEHCRPNLACVNQLPQ